ncbi:MAG: GntR family transcriptional regulator [Oleibacter sp.]|nr:GntR family transcriptional regulator [Thalassolituus sp.]
MKNAKVNAQTIYESLKEMITCFDVRPGSRITETQVSEYFDVSRTPVRAALQRLEVEGFLNIRPKQGCFIRNIDLVTINNYYDVRLELESMVLRLISEGKNDQELIDLSNDWHPEQLNYGLEITDALKAAEEAFHVELSELSGNNVLVNYLRDISDKIRVVRRMGFPDENSVLFTYDDHYRICQLLLHKDLQQAIDEMKNHIRKSQDTANNVSLKQIYGKKSVFE